MKTEGLARFYRDHKEIIGTTLGDEPDRPHRQPRLERAVDVVLPVHGADAAALAGQRQSYDPSGPSTAAVVELPLVHDPDADAPHVLVPRAEVEIVVRFGPAARRGIDAHVLGAREHVRRKVPRGTQRSVSARLRLGTSEAVLGVPASAIVGRILALEDLWGDAAAGRLLERLAAARDGLAAAKVLDAAIAERVATARAWPSKPPRSCATMRSPAGT